MRKEAALAITLLLLATPVFAAVGHNASQVRPGQFAAGNYSFQQSVGIGTATQTALNRLTIDNGADAYGLIIQSTDNPGLKFAPGGTNKLWMLANTAGNFWIESDKNTSFRTNNANRMIITDAGNVGIGTTTPSEKLSVSNGFAIGATGSVIGLTQRLWYSGYISSSGSQNLCKIQSNTDSYASTGPGVKISTRYPYRGGFTDSNYAEYIVTPRYNGAPTIQTIYSVGTVPTLSVTQIGSTQATVALNYAGDSQVWVSVEVHGVPIEWYI